jgi:hypothetical protein
VGLPVANPQPGGRLDADSAELVAEGARAGGDAALGPDLQVDCTQPLNVRLISGGVEGFLGATDNLARKVRLFAALLQDLRRQGGDPQYIDVRVMDRPVWKPKDSAPPAADTTSAPVHPAARPHPPTDGGPHAAPTAHGAPHPAGAKIPARGRHPQKPTGDHAVD